ncbi:thiol-disulfide isomerase [Mycobacterium avium subsp. paratuberculosis S5]|nr:thiol-disulfide isomerase [Mycobacterium avium subsp. paratuberculosis S5]
MRPAHPVGDELAQEHAGHQHAGEALPADVRQVGHRGLQVLLELVGQRHRPAVLTDPLRDRRHPVAELVAAHHAGDPGAQRDGLRAGQRGGLDQVVRVVLAGPHDGVGQNQPALGVGVLHLDGGAAVLRQHIAGPLRGARRHVLRHRHGGDHVDRQLKLRGQRHGGDDGGGPAHVRGHVMHRGRRLDRDAAGVEGDALADQRHLFRLLGFLGQPRTAVDQPHQPRRARRTLADAQNPSVAALLQRLLVEHLHLEADGLTQSPCPLGEFVGKQVTGRGVDQIAGGGDRGRDGRTVRDLLLGVLGGGQHRDLLQPFVFRGGLGAAEFGEPVAAQDQALDGGRGHALAGQRRQRGEHRLGVGQRPRGHPRGTADGVGRPLGSRLAQADGQHAGHRQRSHHQPVQLFGAAGGRQRPQAGFDLGDRVGGQERPGRRDDGARLVVVAGGDDGHDQHGGRGGAAGQRGGDVDDGGGVTGFCAHPHHPNGPPVAAG